MAGRPNLAATLGGWSARHRLIAVGAWLALVVVTVLLGSPGAPGQAAMRSAVSAVQAAVQATGQVNGVRAPVTSASGRQVLLQSTRCT